MTTPEPAIQLWPDGAPQLADTLPEDIPVLRPFLPESGSATAAIVVCPGGGYQGRAEHEGEPVARWLNSLGIAAFVVEYRVAPHRYPVPLGDAQRAIRLVRANAGKWNVTPEKIGILGFSAGGHLAATAGTHWDRGDAAATDPVERESCRPDLLVLCYPVISFLSAGHMGSMRNLLGEAPSLELRRELSAELQVTRDTPPAFLWHTADDAAVDVDNSLFFASALRRYGVPFALHVFPSGAHGLGLAGDHPEAHVWPELCAGFLRQQHWI